MTRPTAPIEALKLSTLAAIYDALASAGSEPERTSILRDLFTSLDRKTLVAGLIMALLLLGGGELLILFGPEFLAWYATNLAIYADALAISALLAVRTRLRHVAVQIRASLASVWRVVTLRGRRPRAIRPPKTTRRAPSGNDNDSDGGRVLAAA